MTEPRQARRTAGNGTDSLGLRAVQEQRKQAVPGGAIGKGVWFGLDAMNGYIGKQGHGGLIVL